MVSLAAAIFDLDGTLLDTSALRAARDRRDWRTVYQHLNAAKPFKSARFDSLAVTALVQQARERGLKTGLLTNVPEGYANELLRAHNIQVDAMVSGSDSYPSKPDPAGLRAITAALDVEASDSIYVGDSVSDFTAAAAIGMTSVGVAWAAQPKIGWRHFWPDIAIDRPATLLRYLDGDRGLGPLGEALATRLNPSVHWGSVLRLQPGCLALGRYFRTRDPRLTKHKLSRLILDAKREPNKDTRIAEIFESLAELIPARARPQLIVSVPPAPGDARDRFSAARAVLATFYGARDGAEVLRMTRAVESYKRTPRDARAALNIGRFVVTAPLSEQRALLIDDVLTSGGQSDACGAALREAGCRSVTVVALAVTQDKLPDLCPECGSSLVKRVRRRDQSPFFGCTRYPSCRYTRSLSPRRQAQSVKANKGSS